MTQRMVIVMGTALLAAGISFACLRTAAADANKNPASDRNNPNDRSNNNPSNPGSPSNPGNSNKAAGPLNPADKAFLVDATRGSQAEIELGQVAAEHGGTPDVIKFGQRMVTDHTRLLNEGRQLAAQKDIALPQDLDPKAKMLKDRLLQTAQRSGVEFDREYMRKMVQDHEQDLTAFQREANNGKDPELQGWAQKNVSVIEEHLRMARTINDSLKKKQTAKR